MHLLERYALASGAKIDKPFIFEKLFPIPFEKYITIHPNSQFNSKNYDYWPEVVNLIYPVIAKEEIQIVQIGTEADPELPFCYRTSGQTDINQVASVIKNSLLHVGADSFPVHLASSFGKKIVALYGNGYAGNAFPYWSEKEDITLLEPDRGLRKPSFSSEENPKSINFISPERVAKSVLDLLNLEHDIRQMTVHNGRLYSTSNIIYETPLNQLVDPRPMKLEKLLCRLDFNHDEEILEKQLELGPCEIATKGAIDIETLRKHKNNIAGIIYHIDKNDSPVFVKEVLALGIEIALVTELPEEELQPKKIDYMDLGLIREISMPQIKQNELKDFDLNKLYYKSNKFTLSMGKTYPSKWAWQNGKEIHRKDELSKVPDHEEFWKESNNFCFVLETS
jgi:hypothetical protein